MTIKRKKNDIQRAPQLCKEKQYSVTKTIANLEAPTYLTYII